MNALRSTVLLFAALPLAAPAAAQVSVYLGATSAQHQAQVQALMNNGYRMISLSIYGTAGSPRYAAVWVQRNGPSFIPFQDLTAAQYQSFVDSNLPTHVPTLVTAMGSGANVRFAGVVEQTGYGLWAQHGIDAQGLRAAADAAQDAGWRLCSADVYNTAGDPRYVITFKPNPGRVGWGYYTATGAQDHQDKFVGMDQLYGRQVIAAFNDDSTQFLSCWEDTLVGGGPIRHDLTAAEYDTLANQYWNQNGQYPLNVCASGSGNGERFAAIWASSDVPVTRQWTMTGTLVPELAAFDNWMLGFMSTGGVRGAQLAIVKDGKLKLARGYTWAEPGYTPVAPTDLFRIASCTKPLTSIAIHRAIQQNPQFDYSTTMASQFGNPSFADQNCNSINVLHLLRHRGGWDSRPGNGRYDPMFWDDPIATAGTLAMPISRTDIRLYMQQQQLNFPPGTAGIYSNYGYCLLGRIVERRNPGKTYAEVIEEQIFQPLGITRPRIGRSHLDDRFPGEVLYHPQYLFLSRSVNDNSRPFVPQHYGGWNQPNMDSHGAWVMAAPDFAKVLAAFDLGLSNPILGPTQTAAMWDQTGTSTWLKGWFLNEVPDGQGSTVAMREHNGVLPGTRTYIARRADGISFVVFTNGDRFLGADEGLQLSNLANAVSSWPAHDLFPSVGLGSFQPIGDIKSPFGSPCPGSTGTPHYAVSGSSMIGGRSSLDLHAVLPNTFAFCVLGFVPTTFDLGPLGAPGCAVFVNPLASNLVLTDRYGAGAYVFDFPAEPSLVGAHLLTQYAIFDPAANPLGVHVSVGIDIQVGGWLNR